jgi:hypothetical protein
MSQRNSGFRRKKLDDYPTPPWVTEALLPHLPARVRTIWEPAAGSGQMARVLKQAGYAVRASDISQGIDFLDEEFAGFDCDAIVTNPPHDKAKVRPFIERALHFTKPSGAVAMLFRTDCDHAKWRRHLFGRCPQFAKKLVLTERIVWFAGPKADPSENHAWFIWDWKHHGPPVLAYWQPDLPADIRPNTRNGRPSPSAYSN